MSRDRAAHVAEIQVSRTLSVALSSMTSSIEARVRLNNGVEMPWLGIGTWQMAPGHTTERAVRTALDIGYRLIDTARLYRNEASVGRAVRESGIPRDEIFVTTKLWNSDHGRDQALRAFEGSLHELGLDYVDLYLIHWPGSGQRAETWKALEAILRDGRARAIGVSNYSSRHLEEMDHYAAVVPAVNQIEFSPFVFEPTELEAARRRGIRVEAYTPLARGRRLDDPRLRAIAAKYGKTPAQTLLRWCLEHEVVTIPKSDNPAHIRENANVFDFRLAPEDVRALDGLSTG